MTQPPSNPPAGQETLVGVDQDASWKAIQDMSRAIADKDEAPTELESALCGAVWRAREWAIELSAAKAQLAEALQAARIVIAEEQAHSDAQLSTAREDMKEECAKVCDRVADLCLRRCADQAAYQLKECAAAIRALKP